MTEQTGPVIMFNGYRIMNLEYKSYSDTDFQKIISKSEMKSIQVASSIEFDEHIGQIKLTSKFANPDNNQIGSITVLGQFKINPIVEDEDEARGYILRNGSAMVYPYVRTMVSMITSLDKGNVTVIPTMNFAEAFENN